MSELRTRMIRDMALRGFSPRTHKSYIGPVVQLARYYKRSPDQLTNEEVQAYLAHLLQDRKLAWSTCSQAAHAFRFLYHVTLGHSKTDFHVPAPRQPQKLPEILSREEVWRLLESCTHTWHRLLLATTYAAGLRVSEVVALKVSDLDADRMTVRVQQGKGMKHRYIPLAKRLLHDFRVYWKTNPPGIWLFPNRQRTRPIDLTVAQKVYTMAKLRAGIRKQGGIHAPLSAIYESRPPVKARLFILCFPPPIVDETAGSAGAARGAVARFHYPSIRARRRIGRLTRCPVPQRRAMHAIETCRTAALGGHRDTCDTCGAVQISYNSCRNRHCPKCQPLAKERWLDARRAELLPIEYFHLVFTLPHPLHPLAQGTPRVIYSLLFHAVADTLTTFGRDPRHLGGDLGGTAILHTWGQTLSQHLHLHCVVTGGALAAGDTRWIAAPPGFLFPVRALAVVFRGKFLDALRRAFAKGTLRFTGSLAALAAPTAFTTWLDQLRHPAWVAYAKRPFAGPTQVLEYLGRYTHRVALTNERLLSLDAGLVRFRWKDYADGDRVKVMALDAAELLRRFLLHVVPRGFVRIRHFRLLANRTRKANLARCRALLASTPAPAVPLGESVHALMLRLTGLDIARCAVCQQGRLRLTEILAPVSDPPRLVAIRDTS